MKLKFKESFYLTLGYGEKITIPNDEIWKISGAGIKILDGYEDISNITTLAGNVQISGYGNSGNFVSGAKFILEEE